ncbi:MAG: S9 family peptidase [Gammaproteobacteria bacterium]|nr:S9 family peptidase [Gammaproteobacteria bacterium]
MPWRARVLARRWDGEDSRPSCEQPCPLPAALHVLTMRPVERNRERLMRLQPLLFALPAVFFTFAAQATGEEKKDEKKDYLFQSSDVFNLEYADDPQVSPDGKRVVYVRTAMDIMSDRPRSNVWVLNADGSDHRPLLSGRQNYSSPRWSPDGERLAYLSGAEGSPQLYVRWMDSGQTALLTNLTQAPGEIAWSPDGRWLAFTMFVPSKKKPLAEVPEKPEGADWAAPVTLVDTMVYRIDGEGFLESGYDHVFVVPAEGGTPRRLTGGDFNHNGPLSWTPDSAQILVTANRAEDWEYDPIESEIFAVSVADGTLAQLTNRNGPDAAPQISPDGRRIAYLGFDDQEQGHQLTRLYVMNRDGGSPRLVSGDFDRDMDSPRWAGDGRGVYFLFDERGERKLGLATLDGRVTAVTGNIGGTDLGRPYTSGVYSLAPDGTYAVTVNTPHRPADIAVGKERRAPKQVTHLNEDLFGHKQLGQVKAMAWISSHDGREIQGWVVTPPEFDSSKKYPLILEVHGGPFAAYGPNYTTEIQLYAAAGYVVLYANPRGSTSYGEEFANLIHHAYPGNDYDDLLSGVDAVVAEGYIDTDNLFVTGGSGGGVLTAWIVGRTDRFRAAAVAKPVINWTSFSLTADFSNYFYKYWFPGMPWERQDEYWRRSPLSLAGNVTTPTMLLTGEADYRTPISESEQFYQALKLRKIETAMVRVPGAPHGIAGRPSNLVAKVDNILAWFEKHRIGQDKQAESAGDEN